MTESLAYSLRLAGVRTGFIAIALSFVTSTLLVSRLSNMFQAPLLGAMVDFAIIDGSQPALLQLEWSFRLVIFSAFLGVVMGAFMTPTVVQLFVKAINHFSVLGSVPKVFFYAMHPSRILMIVTMFKLPSFSMCKGLSWSRIPKQFLLINCFVTSIYCIGVLCALLAGAYLPEFRSTALQLSGIVNGMATILFTIFVDPAGARVTDQASRGQRSIDDVRSVVFFLQMGKLVGTLILAQLFLLPFMTYIKFFTLWLTTVLK